MSLEFAIGCLETILSIILFGSIYVPVKKYNAQDGMFCLFLLGISSFMVSFIVYAFQGFEPKVYPLVTLGGALWMVGNTAVIPIVNRVGLAIGYLIWNTIGCVIGWSATYFGFFGLEPKPAAIPWMNFVGVGVVLIGGAISSFVEKFEPSANEPSVEQNNIETLPTPIMINYSIKLKINEELPITFESYTRKPSKISTNNAKIGFNGQKLIGLGLAVFAGIFFGVMNIPMYYIQDNPEKFDNAPTDMLSYIYSQFLGIFIMAVIEFAIYSIIKKNKPIIMPELVLPGLLSGVIFSVGQVVFFRAVEALTVPIAFPIVAMVHGLVAACWSLFYFKEIQGTKNYILIGTAFGVNLIGSTLIALSK